MAERRGLSSPRRGQHGAAGTLRFSSDGGVELSRLAFYITSHGYGHGARSGDTLRYLANHHPEVEVTVVTALPKWFLEARIPAGHYRRAHFDVGMVQKDSVKVDLEATYSKVSELLENWSKLVESEVAWLKSRAIELVVTDIPAIPLEAAQRAGLTNVAIGNFSWDFIYSEFAAEESRWEGPVEAFREAYNGTDLLLRLPFHAAMESFPRLEDVPLVAVAGQGRRQELAQLTGADPNKSWILLSFTTLELKQGALSRLQSFDNHQFFTVKPLEWPGSNLFSVPPDYCPFTDMVASVEAVVTKPGFGILSECQVNGTPLLYVERENFLEYPVLEKALKESLRSLHIPAADLYHGRLGPALAKLEAGLPEPFKPVPSDGGRTVVERLVSLL